MTEKAPQLGDVPVTRWEGADNSGFAAYFAGLIESGADLEGEARLADAMLPRGATVLDAGAGFGRVGAALQGWGHQVVAAEKDAELVAMAATYYPELPMVRADILELSPALLAEAGHPAAYDLIVVVGNVMILLAPDTERRALSTLAGLLVEGGRLLVGFHPKDSPASSARAYPFDEFAADVRAAGLEVQHRFGTYELEPPADDYVVAVLTRAYSPKQSSR